MPRSTTAPGARGCARSTPSTPPPTAAGTPRAPSTRPARWLPAPRPTSCCGPPTRPCPPSSPPATGPPAGSCSSTEFHADRHPPGDTATRCRWCRAERVRPTRREASGPRAGWAKARRVLVSLLQLDPTLVARARELAARAAQPVVDLAHRHTTVSVERAVLRLAGLTGTDPVTGEGRAQDQVPWVNRVSAPVRQQVGLGSGVALPVWHALASGTAPSLQSLAEQVGRGTARFESPADPERARAAARDAVAAGLARVDANRRRREELIAAHGDPPRRPWIYLIVATGDIHEDIPQAQ